MKKKQLAPQKASIKNKILALDDEEIIRRFLKDVLSVSGFEIVCFEKTDEAFKYLKTNKTDVILSDIYLSGGQSGINFLKEIKTLYPDVPVILITGVPNVETASTAMRLGAFDYITKPLRANNIIEAVKKAINSKISLEDKRKKEAETEEYKNFLKREIESKTDELKITRDNYQSLIEYAPEMICVVDEERRLSHVNKTLLEKTGYSLEEIDKMRIDDLVPKKQHKKLMEHFKNVFEFKYAKSIELNFIKKNGAILDVDIHSTIQQSPRKKGKTLCQSYVRDVTDRNQLINKLLDAEKHATVGQFAGCIGHEMNNIVTSLMGYLELANQDMNDKALIKKVFEIFETQSQRILTLSENLLTLSATRSENRQPVHIDKIIDQTIELLKPTSKIKKCIFAKEYEPKIPPVIGDEMKFQQLLTNLIINAADAMENKGIIKLKTKYHQASSEVELCVEDFGCGIPKENLKMLFDGFYTTKPAGKGTGLGMLVIKEITDRYNGRIDIQSHVGKGTKVSIIFPAIK